VNSRERGGARRNPRAILGDEPRGVIGETQYRGDMKTLSRDPRLSGQHRTRTISVLLLHRGEKRIDGFVERARRLNMGAQLGPGREAVLARDYTLCVVELEIRRLAECIANALNGGCVGGVERLVERLRFVLEMIEMRARRQIAGRHKKPPFVDCPSSARSG
jgi:hypothetical protein